MKFCYSVNIRKASQAKPAAPAKDTVTSTSITLKPGDESGKGTANLWSGKRWDDHMAREPYIYRIKPGYRVQF